METYVVDTHSLIWFIAEDDRLSWQAKQIFEKAEQVEAQILIPIIVLAEIAYIAQKKRVEITIDTILECINKEMDLPSCLLTCRHSKPCCSSQVNGRSTIELLERLPVTTNQY